MEASKFGQDTVLGKWLWELSNMEVFEAQTELENRLLSAARAELESITATSCESLSLAYMRVKTKIETIRELQSKRLFLIDNRNPALKERK